MVRPVGILRFLGPALLALGAASLAIALALGEATLSLVVIFPVITATGAWAFLGILFVVAGLFTTFLLWPARILATAPPIAEPPQDPLPAGAVPTGRSRWGGVVFLGPFPIVFGSDQRVTLLMLVIGLALLVGLMVVTLLAFVP